MKERRWYPVIISGMLAVSLLVGCGAPQPDATAEATAPPPTATTAPVSVSPELFAMCDRDGNGIVASTDLYEIQTGEMDVNSDGFFDFADLTACSALKGLDITPTPSPTLPPTPEPTLKPTETFEPLPFFNTSEVKVKSDFFELTNYEDFNWSQAGRHIAQTRGYPDEVEGRPFIPELTIIPYSDGIDRGFWFWTHEEKDGLFGSKIEFRFYFYDPGATIFQDTWTISEYQLPDEYGEAKWVYPGGPDGYSELWFGKALLFVGRPIPVIYADH